MRGIVARTRRDRWSGLFCAAEDCAEWAGPDRGYCSTRCQNTEAARRKRYRMILRRDAVPCLACGVEHYEDGSVSLPNGGRRR